MKILSDYLEVYEEAIRLVNEESKNDPPADLYQSHYKARNLLFFLKKSILEKLTSFHAEDSSTDDGELRYKAVLAFICRDLGRIYIFTEEMSSGESELLECLDIVDPYKGLAETIIPHVSGLNELSIIHANRQHYKQAQESLMQSEQLYRQYKNKNTTALDITSIFSKHDVAVSPNGSTELESLYTMTCFYMAQVYGHLGDMEKSASYCNLTLRRQLKSNNYDPIDFALNAATLSQYYVGEQHFKQSRHHLAAATLIMTNYKTEILTPHLTEQHEFDGMENFNHRYADVARCWAKYGLCLLQCSRERLFRDENIIDLTEDVKALDLNKSDYRFTELDVTAWENRISCNYCLTFDDAKPVFFFVIKWLDQAKEYYKAETEATEYSKIIKDYAECYELISFFEENPKNQAKMHKKRAKYYEDLLELLNPVFYKNICRECWYNAGNSYNAVLDIQLDLSNDKTNLSSEEIKKINLICVKAINNFQHYVKSYIEKGSDNWCSNMDTEEQRTMLYAHFHLGRLHYKLIAANLAQKLENLNNCFNYYKSFTSECENREEVSKSLQGEIGVCREMICLLPIKIANLKRQING